MKYCDKCKMETDYEDDICPLCQNVLKGHSQSIFPNIPNLYKENKKFFYYLSSICVLISVVAIFIDIVIPTKVNFSMFVICGIICLLIILKNGINKHYNLSKTTVWQILIISILSFLWDYFTGYHKWSITYVIPIICLVGSINIVLLLKLLKLYVEDYLIYFIIVALLGLVPIVFLVLNLVTTNIPSLICIFINAILFILLIVYKKVEVIEELKRRLHI